MTKSENLIKAELTKRGCCILSTGWPDFLVLDKQNNIFCIEVKQGRDKVKPNQKKIHKLLNLVGLPVNVVRSSNDLVRLTKRIIFNRERIL